MSISIKNTKSIVFLFILCFFFLSGDKAYSATITTGQNCSLYDAIISAESDIASGGCVAGNGADTIVMGQSENLSLGLPTITSEITILGNNQSINFSPAPDERLFLVVGANLTIENLNILSSVATPAVEDGGFMLTEDSTVKIINSLVSGFQASSFGGAIYMANTDLEIVKSTFTRNSQTSPGYILGGGAIATFGSNSKIKIIGSHFQRNKASGQGGAVLSIEGALNISKSNFSVNYALHGSAISISSWADDLALSVFDSLFFANESMQGGAITWRGPGGRAVLERNLFHKNVGHSHGASFEIYGSGKIRLINSTFSENRSFGMGSAILNYANNASVDMAYNTFVGNQSSTGAVASYFGNGWLDAVLENSLFYQNSGGDCYFSSTQNLSTVGNISESTVCGGPASNGFIENLAFNGGDTRTHKILNESNAVDSATQIGVRVRCPRVDQRGALRPFDGNGDGIPVCDVGAFELRESPAVPSNLNIQKPTKAQNKNNR